MSNMRFASDGFSYLHAHASASIERAASGWTEAPKIDPEVAALSVHEALARVRRERLAGSDALGRLCSLSGLSIVDALLRLYEEDAVTSRQGGRFGMTARDEFFFGPPAVLASQRREGGILYGRRLPQRDDDHGPSQPAGGALDWSDDQRAAIARRNGGDPWTGHAEPRR